MFFLITDEVLAEPILPDVSKERHAGDIIPLTSPSADTARPVAAGLPKMKVLVVEPDLLSARVLKAKLESWDFNVHVEATERVAREWLAAEPYRVAIFNMEDQEAGGLELCRRLRAKPQPSYTYVIGCGAALTKQTLVSALDAGADDYMFKPFHVPELRMRMHRARRALVLDEALFQGGGTDPATGVLNRNAFEQFLQVILAQTDRLGIRGAMMFVRIENLQEIFRRHGYQAMHDVVLELAVRMRTVHRTSDLLAKTGDDEFCLLLQNTHWDLCRPLAERIADLAGDLHVEARRQRVRPVISIGVINFPTSEPAVGHYLDPGARIHYRTIGGDRTDDPQPSHFIV